MLKLKNLLIKSKVISSPMADCTDLPYRLLSRQYGLEFCYLEMVAAESLIRENKKTFELMKTLPEDKPLGAQIVGCRAEAMAEAASMVESMGYDLLDINLGCPVPKIAGQGAGSALLNQPKTCENIFKAIMSKVKAIPVTVKMRLGVQDATGQEAAQIAKIAQDCGLSAVAVHGRTRIQGYSGKADYNAIAKVKEAVTIPVIGNGDIHSAEDALNMMRISGCDAVMVGRGGLGNPWIFKEIEHAMTGHKKPSGHISLEDKKRALLKHFELELEHRPAKTAVLYMRRIAAWYFKNMPGASDFRCQINSCQEPEHVRQLIENFGYHPGSSQSHESDLLD